LFRKINAKIEVLCGITWTIDGNDGKTLTDIIDEDIASKKLFEFQQFLICAVKN